MWSRPRDPHEQRRNSKARWRMHGVAVKTKISPTGSTIAAFAKTDDFMHELVEYHDADEETNLHIQALAKARLASKSTQEETRAQKFVNIASLPWPNGQPMLPIPLIYAGAKTHRLAGGWGMNLQNLARDTGKSKLRSSIAAPEGFKIVSADSSQVEARIAACICGQTDLLDAFRRGIDVYAEFASIVFGRPITKKNNPVERFIGKTGILSLQYGSGWPRFHLMVTTQAQAAGIDLQGYLQRASRQADCRYVSQRYMPHSCVLEGAGPYQAVYPVERSYIARSTARPCNNHVQTHTPAERALLRYYDDPADEKLWGGTLLKHICQSLAYVILMQAARRMHRKGLRFVWQVHDELIFWSGRARRASQGHHPRRDGPAARMAAGVAAGCRSRCWR